MKKFDKTSLVFSNLNKKIIRKINFSIKSRKTGTGFKMMLQNIVVKLKKRFLFDEKHFVDCFIISCSWTVFKFFVIFSTA